MWGSARDAGEQVVGSVREIEKEDLGWRGEGTRRPSPTRFKVGIRRNGVSVRTLV